MEAFGELQINTVSEHAANTNTDRTKPTSHYCNKAGHYKNQCPRLKNQKEPAAHPKKTILETTKVHPQTLTPTPTTTTTITTTKITENLELSTLLMRHVATRTTPQRDVVMEPMQQTGHFVGRGNQEDRLDLKNRTHSTF